MRSTPRSHDKNPINIPFWKSQLGLALLSASSLMLEISLTRLLSTLFFPPYVFTVISLAILGIGVGAALASWRSSLRNIERVSDYALAASLSTLGLIVFAIVTSAINLQLILFFLIAMPYVFVGMVFATVFAAFPEKSAQLYMADLVGAGLGVVLVIPVLNLMGAINAGLLTAVLFGLCGLFFATQSLRYTAILTVVSIIVLGGNLQADFLEPDFSAIHADKAMKTVLKNDGEIIETRWDAFSRTDLVQPNNDSPYQIYVDGGAGSVMPPITDNEFLLRDIGFFPFATSQPRRMMVIGPGGGLDVWFGLQINHVEIVAVEVNRASVDLVKEYADYNGGLYDQPTVRVVVDEGRSVLRRENATYDLIFLSQTITSVAERSGYALTENTLYTVEAFGEYLDHLTDNGEIALKLYDEITLTRAVSVAVAAFNERGLSDSEALGHITAFLDPSSDPPIPLLVVRKQAYTQDDALALGAVAREVGFSPLYLPGVLAQPPLDAVEAGETSIASVIAEADADISATTDNHPFFFEVEQGLPEELTRLWIVLGLIVVTGLGLLGYMQMRNVSQSLRWSPIYFAGLGIGFIAIEILVIQQARLFLGHPTISITTVLGVMLIGGGGGSWLLGDLDTKFQQRVPLISTIIVMVLAGIWFVVWPSITDVALQSTLYVRIFVTIAALLPLAVVMGMPFPMGLSKLTTDGQQVAIAWAVNGVATVVGSVGAVTLAIAMGYQFTLLLGIAAYGLSAIVALVINTQE